PRTPRSPLFPYTTLFRSPRANGQGGRALAGPPISRTAGASIVGPGRSAPRGDLRDPRTSFDTPALARLHSRAIAVADSGEATYQDRKSTRLNSSHVSISY